MSTHGPRRLAGHRISGPASTGLDVNAGPDFLTDPDRACAHPAIDADMFFSASDKQQNQARRTCRGCPFQQACLRYALDNGETHGVWGSVLMSSAAEVETARAAMPASTTPRPDRPIRLTRAQRTAQLEDGVRRHYDQDQPDSIIALKLGIHIGTVTNIRRRLGLAAIYGSGGRRIRTAVNA